MIKAILFDMDGVLIEAKDWHYHALNRALEHFGFSISRDAHLSTFDGLSTKQKLNMLSKSRGLPVGLIGFINDLKQSYTLEISVQKCNPVFQHQYALSKLKKGGLKLAVCSNSVRGSVEEMMRLSGLTQYLNVMLSNQDVASPKPDPEIYLKAMDLLKLKPSECLILEDNEHGIQAAKASGAHLMQIGTPNDVRYDLIEAKIKDIENYDKGI